MSECQCSCSRHKQNLALEFCSSPNQIHCAISRKFSFTIIIVRLLMIRKTCQRSQRNWASKHLWSAFYSIRRLTIIFFWGKAFKLFDSSNITDNNETALSSAEASLYCGEAGEKEKESAIIDILMGIPSGSLCGGERRNCVLYKKCKIKWQPLSEATTFVLRLIAVSVYTVAVDSGSIVAENNDACMLFTLKDLFIAVLKFVC